MKKKLSDYASPELKKLFLSEEDDIALDTRPPTVEELGPPPPCVWGPAEFDLSLIGYNKVEKMTDKDLSNVVSDLNDNLHEELRDEGVCFAFMTDGYVQIIEFANFTLWSSDWDERGTDEDTGEYLITVKEHVIDRFKWFVGEFNKVKFTQ